METRIAVPVEPGFAELYAATRDATYRAVLLSLRHRERAEDAVHEAFARALSRWPELQQHPQPVAWLVRVALNVDRSAWRVWRREQPEPPELVAPPQEGSLDPWLVRQVWRLPRRQREVVALRILADLDTEQTGRVLGIAPGTVTAHLHRGLTSLRAAITASQITEAT